MSTVALVILIGIMTGCGLPRDVPLRLEESTGELSRHLAIELRSGRDHFGGEAAVGLELSIQNLSSQPMTGCSLGLDDHFRAPFDSLEVFRGFFQGNTPWGHQSLAAGEKVTFEFHHDNNNYGIVRASDGSMPSTNTIPRSIEVVCSDLRARWATMRVSGR